MQVSLRDLARLSGCGNNHMRVAGIYHAKKYSGSVEELLSQDDINATFRPRKDKLSGDPIWIRAWHNFMALKKGQSFRCAIVKTGRIKDARNGRFVWQTEWARHQKRFMSMTMAEFHKAVIKWEPYLQWRAEYLKNNPLLPSTWHVGTGRLYKEKCFCIDAVEAVRKCGCEYHLKMAELVAGLKKWRRSTSSKIKQEDPTHSCNVSTVNAFVSQS